MAAKPPLDRTSASSPSLVPAGEFANKPPIPIKKAVVIIGSDEQCHLRLVSSTISRLHALIVSADDGVYIHDLASRSKVLVNGREVREAELNNGDEVRLGRFAFKFNSPNASVGLTLRADPASVKWNGGAKPLQISGRAILVGRAAEADICVSEDAVSSRHAIIFEGNGKRYIRDLNTRTGTFLNGQKIHQKELKVGDSIRVGETTLSVMAGAAAPAPAEALRAPPPPVPAPKQPPVAARPAEPPVVAPAPIEPEPADLPPLPLDTSEEAAPVPVSAQPANEEPALDLDAVDSVQSPAATPEESPIPVAEDSVHEEQIHEEPVHEEAVPLAVEPPTVPTESFIKPMGVPAAPIPTVPPIPATAPEPEPIPLVPEPEEAINFASAETAQPVPASASDEAPINFAPADSDAPLPVEEIPDANRPRRGWRSDSWMDESPTAGIPDKTPANIAVPPTPASTEDLIPLEPEVEAVTNAGAVEPPPSEAVEPVKTEEPAPAAHAEEIEPEEVPDESPQSTAARFDNSRAKVKRIPPPSVSAPSAVIPVPSIPIPSIPVPPIPIPVPIPIPAPRVAPSVSASVASASPAAAPEPVELDMNDLPPVPPSAATASAPVVPEPAAEEAPPSVEQPSELDFCDLPASLPPQPSVSAAEPAPLEISAPPMTPAVETAPVDSEIVEASQPPEPVEPEISGLGIRESDLSTPVPVEEEKPPTVDFPDGLEIHLPEATPPQSVELGATASVAAAQPPTEELEESAPHEPLSADADLELPPIPSEHTPPAEEPPSSAEVLDKSEAFGQATLDLDLALPPTPTTPEPPASMPSDTAFAQIIESQDGESTGPLVEAAPETAPQPGADESNLTTAPPDVQSDATFTRVPPPPQSLAVPEESPAVETFEAPAAEAPITPLPSIPPIPVIPPPLPRATAMPLEIPPLELGDAAASEAPVEEPPRLEENEAFEFLESEKSEPLDLEPPPIAPASEQEVSTPPPPKDAEPCSVEPAVAEAPTAELPPISLPPEVTPPLSADLESSGMAEPPVVAPPPPPPAAPASPRVLDVPMVSLGGGFGIFGTSTVNVDHHLGGMPIQLQELPPAPADFGRIAYRFDSRQKSALPKAPPPEIKAPQAASLSPPPPLAPEAPPIPAAPASEAVPPSAPPPVKPASAPAQRPPRPKRPSTPFATDPFDATAQNLASPSKAPVIPPYLDPGKISARPTTAFEGLAMNAPPPDRDVFSDHQPMPMNDAAFGGPSLNRGDDYNIPESDARAEQFGISAEEDFAEDDFWNRTDEEDGLPPMNLAASRKPAPAPEPVVPPEPAAEPEPATEPQTASETEPSSEPEPVDEQTTEPPPAPLEETAPLPIEEAEPAPQQEPEPEPEPQPQAVQRPPVPPQIPTPPPRKRRRLRIPFLMPALLLGIVAALAVIWYLVPTQAQVTAKLTFFNYDWTPGTSDADDFAGMQRRILGDDQTRLHAVDLLHQTHPSLSAGFLEIPTLYSRAISTLDLSSTREGSMPQTVAQLTYKGTDGDGDRARMGALLQSVIDANGPVLDNNRRLLEGVKDSQRAVYDASQKMQMIQSQIADAQLVIDQQPSPDDLAQLAGRKTELQREKFAAEDRVDADRNALARLQAATVLDTSASAAGSDNSANSADPQLNTMRQQLADLTSELAAARADQAAGATLARQQLEASVRDFSDQLSAADAVLGNSSQLRQFVDSAKDSQNKARELIDMLIVDGQDLEKQLENTRRDVEDLIQSRQEEKWAADAQLQELQASLDSAQHQYNANIGQGKNDPRVLDPLQKEIDDYTSQVKARQAQLGVDANEVKVEEGLNALIKSLREKLDHERQEIDEVLDPLQKQLADLDPVVAALPGAQQDLARQLHQRLDGLNEARRKYAQAVGEDQMAPSPKVTQLQAQIDELKTRFDRRQADLTQQLVKSLDAQHAQDLAAAQDKLNEDQKDLESARKAYDDARIALDDKTAARDAADAAQQRILRLTDDKTAAIAAMATAQHDHDDKQAQAQRAYDIKPVSDSDITVAAGTDLRMIYSLIVTGTGLLAFAGLALHSHSRTRRMMSPEREAEVPQPPPPPQAEEPGPDLADDDEQPLTV